MDKAEQYVSWMGWEMYLGFDRDMGLSLWNLVFLGDRIAYELAPQEGEALVLCGKTLVILICL